MTTWTRREALELGIAAAVAFAVREHMGAQRLTAARDAVDHLILACADLQQGMAWFEERTGVRAVIGGSHPGRGTHNALLSLGSRQYLEIIAPDPAQLPGLQPDLAALRLPRLAGWASASRDLTTLVRTARAAGAAMSDPRDGERKRPDGRTIRWRTAAVTEEFSAGGISPVPFFIEWAPDSIHPSGDSPAGCRLQGFRLEHPKARPLQDLLKQLGIETAVAEAAAPALVADLATPKGDVVLR